MATAQTVYVQFTPTAVGAANGTVTVASTGATSQTVTLNGTGISASNTAPTLNAINDVTLCYTPVQQTIALGGITPGSEATQTVVLSITSTNPALFSQLGVFPIVGGTTGQINYTIAPNASGTAVVTVTVKDNGGTANGGVDTYTRSFNITVNSLPNVNIESNVGTNITRGVTAQLTATAGGTTYTWSPAADIISGQNTATVTVRPKASETFTVVVGNALSCTTSQTITINVSTLYPLVTNNIITPNGDGKNDTWIIKNIDYYPASTVKVVDKAGKVVFSATNYLNDWAGTYNGQPLTQGTYYYVIDLGSGAPKYTGYVTIIRD
jgi:gliding motility-associated-like protein